MSQLKPCPMCGNEALLMECSAGWWAECSHGFECGVSLDSHNWTQEGAVAKWNARVADARLERLEKLLREAADSGYLKPKVTSDETGLLARIENALG